VAGTACALAITVVGLLLVLMTANDRSRSELRHNLVQRERSASALFSALLSASTEPSGVPSELRQREVNARDLHTMYVSAQGGLLALQVYNARGVELGGQVFFKAAPAVAPSETATLLARLAQNGGSYISNVIGTGAGTALDLATEYQTPYGIRIVVEEFPIGAISMLLPGYMHTFAGNSASAYLLDDSGRAIATSFGNILPGQMVPNTPLMQALHRHQSGEFHIGGIGWYYTSARVGRTAWTLILAVRDAVLYAPVSGLSVTAPRIALGLLTLLGLAVLTLVNRTQRDARRLSGVNSDLALRNTQVEQANAAKSEFIAGMSHELRTPLNAIIGFAELMHDGRVGPVSDDHREYLGDILTSARHLLELINDMLDISKVEAGRMELDPEDVDLHEVVAAVEPGLRALAGERGLRLETDIGPGLTHVWIDPRRLRQVLINYASNAVKFTPAGGEVRIVLRARGDVFDLEVHDTGVGISPEDLGKLFSEFVRLRSNDVDAPPGTGLGLALTRRLVEAQGGRVSVTSSPGEGSIFGATLPLVRPGETADRQPIASAVAAE
jgi:signal transduction histidine kinase